MRQQPSRDRKTVCDCLKYRHGKHNGQGTQMHRFISLFFSHILPKGFTRIRFSGFLSCGQRSKRLESIFRQVCQKSYTVSPIKGLKGIQLMKALFPNSSFGVCPICNTPTTPIAFGSAVNRAKFYKPKQRCNSRGQPAC